MRFVVLGNQRLLVNMDQNLSVRDIFYKRVGQENHVLGTPHRIGVWCDNQLSWLDEPAWEKKTHSECSLCSISTVTNHDKNITLTFQDLVLKDTDVLIRTITSTKPIKLFVYHYFFLYGDGIGDCAGYDAKHNAVFHYKRNRYFLMTALHENKSVLTDYTVSVPEHEREAWRDAYDGHLSKNAIAQGHVDSCISFDITPGKKIEYVLCAGRSFTHVSSVFEHIRLGNREKLIAETLSEQHSYATAPMQLKKSWQDIYETSILVLRAHTDSGGAITAANDADNMMFNKDTYSYVWGRDGALVSYSLDTAAKHELARSFFGYMRSTIEPGGYYLHKYHPDGSLGSSWHAWVRDGKEYLPLQEDSTALMLYALKHHHEKAKDDYLADKYEWIASMADFLCAFVREDIALPQDCWDLWEERQGIHTWTLAATIAGLKAAAFFAHIHDDDKREQTCTQLAERFTSSLQEFHASKEWKRFVRRLTPELQQDLTIDAADMAPFLFGVLPADNPLVKNTVEAIEKNLMTPSGGIARYQGDYFHRKTEEAPGNAWIISTLWVAQWHIAMGNKQRAEELIDWVAAHATTTHLLAEQIHPLTGEPLAVCPLTWSHATFIETIHNYTDAP